ncbi:pyridoxal phosphate-dependent aminotransferase [Micromonospora sp. NPDC051227]|uniref:pyridoxal phosphate-dependent aminotransferase n=1 Tax=Micromonospora sp. NPDC051227 TaxID=3364285 RepID=UPI0037A218BA
MTRPPLSRRVSGLSALELAQLLRTAQAVGAIDIALGIPPGTPPSAAVAGAVEALRSGHHQYSDPAGLLALREQVAADLLATRGAQVDPESEITITCGATEGTMMALLAVTDPGDEVILLDPAFETYFGTVELCGAVARRVALRNPGWRLDIAALRAAISPRTRAIVVNTPHNPTGRSFDATELNAIIGLCCEYGLTCITDEVYERFIYDGRPHVSPLTLPGASAHSIVLGSLSKTLSMSGWRIGYCLADPEVTAALRKVHQRTTIGASTPLQHGAAASTASWWNDVDEVKQFQHRRDEMANSLDQMGFEVSVPEGGWFILAGTEGLGVPSDELAARLVTSAGVLVAPGTAFFAERAEGRRWIRTTFVRDHELTVEALERMRKLLG